MTHAKIHFLAIILVENPQSAPFLLTYKVIWCSLMCAALDFSLWMIQILLWVTGGVCFQEEMFLESCYSMFFS